MARRESSSAPSSATASATGTRAQRLSALQNGAIGSLAGMIEVLLQQPTVAMKNAIQQHRPIPWSVPALYRGVGVSLASIAPVSAVQFAVNGRLLRALDDHDANTPPSARLQITAAALAGCCSSLLSSPAELVMTLQQNTGRGFVATIREITAAHGPARLLRGLEATMLREAAWCAGYLALGPVLTRAMHDASPGTFGPSPESASPSQRASAAAVGSVLAGLATVYATQPLDTIKTVMQGEAMRAPGATASAWGTARRLYAQPHGGGLGAFYRGAVPRGARLIGAVFILGKARDALEELFDDHALLADWAPATTD